MRLKPAQNCKHNIVEHFSSVGCSFTKEGSSKPGNSAELGEKSRQMETFPNLTPLGTGEKRSRRHAVSLCTTKASPYKHTCDLS